MDTYFPVALAVASNTTDAYVGKYWNGFFPEQSSLGQSRVSLIAGTSQNRVISDFTGVATYTPFGGLSVTYDNALRSKVVGTTTPGVLPATQLGLNPSISVGIEYTGYTEFVYAHDIVSGQAAIVARDISSTTWYTSTTFYAGLNADYESDMLLHTNIVGNADPRVMLLGNFSARYSNPYPSATGTTWTTATTFPDGYAKLGFASKAGVVTAVGDGGRVRYTTDGMTWAGTVISGGGSVTLNCATWTTDGNTCIAAGDNGALAISSDGQTFTLSAALQGTVDWVNKRAAAIVADPAAASRVYVICTDGTIAVSSDYGATWLAATGCFTPNQRYGTYPVNRVPVSCWMASGYLYISLYGGQVLRTTGAAIATDVSNDFNQYYSSFGTPDITGMHVDTSLTPTGTVRGVLAGGFGRVLYILTGTPIAFSPDTTLVSALVSGGFQTAEVCSAYYDPTIEMVFVGLTNGRVAHRRYPLTFGSGWNVDVLPGVVGDIVGVHRLPTGGYLAVANYQDVAVGYVVGGSNLVTWAVNSSLSAYTSSTYAKQVTSDGSAVQVLIGAESVARTTDGTSWFVTSPGSYYSRSGNDKESSLTFDPRMVQIPGVSSPGTSIMFYEDIFYSYVATAQTTNPWIWSQLGGSNFPPAVGCFTFGTNRVSIALKPDGTGYISTNPTGYGSWGTVPGVGNKPPNYVPPPFISNFYYPTSPVYSSAGTVTAVDVGIAVGANGRIWFSYNL
jgi:hypothetical protein